VQTGLPFYSGGFAIGHRLRQSAVFFFYRGACATATAWMVRGRLTTCPFYVGTVASLLGKPNCFC
jgi:hypothetical protein